MDTSNTESVVHIGKSCIDERDSGLPDPCLAGLDDANSNALRSLRILGSSVSRQGGTFSGLVNQGATCYLNSLLQNLYFDAELRQSIYNWKYCASEHGEAHRCVTLQLQQLFAEMQLSSAQSTPTTKLTRSFGWDAQDSYQQHDISEALILVIEAVQKETIGSDLYDHIVRKHIGNLTHYLHCSVCNNKSERVEPFLSLPLPLVPRGTVLDCLHSFLAEETLDGENAYSCSNCNKKTRASKGISIRDNGLPSSLYLQLNRFEFDPETFERKKVDTAISIPPTITFIPSKNGAMIATTGYGMASSESTLVLEPTNASKDSVDASTEIQGSDNIPCESNAVPNPWKGENPRAVTQYELAGVVAHIGGSTRGHYLTYIRDSSRTEKLRLGEELDKSWCESHQSSVCARVCSSPWFCFNDSSVTRIPEETKLHVLGLAPLSSKHPTACSPLQLNGRGQETSNNENQKPSASSSSNTSDFSFPGTSNYDSRLYPGAQSFAYVLIYRLASTGELANVPPYFPQVEPNSQNTKNTTVPGKPDAAVPTSPSHPNDLSEKASSLSSIPIAQGNPSIVTIPASPINFHTSDDTSMYLSAENLRSMALNSPSGTVLGARGVSDQPASTDVSTPSFSPENAVAVNFAVSDPVDVREIGAPSTTVQDTDPFLDLVPRNIAASAVKEDSNAKSSHMDQNANAFLQRNGSERMLIVPTGTERNKGSFELELVLRKEMSRDPLGKPKVDANPTAQIKSTVDFVPVPPRALQDYWRGQNVRYWIARRKYIFEQQKIRFTVYYSRRNPAYNTLDLPSAAVTRTFQNGYTFQDDKMYCRLYQFGESYLTSVHSPPCSFLKPVLPLVLSPPLHYPESLGEEINHRLAFRPDTPWKLLEFLGEGVSFIKEILRASDKMREFGYFGQEMGLTTSVPVEHGLNSVTVQLHKSTPIRQALQCILFAIAAQEKLFVVEGGDRIRSHALFSGMHADSKGQIHQEPIGIDRDTLEDGEEGSVSLRNAELLATLEEQFCLHWYHRSIGTHGVSMGPIRRKIQDPEQHTREFLDKEMEWIIACMKASERSSTVSTVESPETNKATVNTLADFNIGNGAQLLLESRSQETKFAFEWCKNEIPVVMKVACPFLLVDSSNSTKAQSLTQARPVCKQDGCNDQCSHLLGPSLSVIVHKQTTLAVEPVREKRWHESVEIRSDTLPYLSFVIYMPPKCSGQELLNRLGVYQTYLKKWIEVNMTSLAVPIKPIGHDTFSTKEGLSNEAHLLPSTAVPVSLMPSQKLATSIDKVHHHNISQEIFPKNDCPTETMTFSACSDPPSSTILSHSVLETPALLDSPPFSVDESPMSPDLLSGLTQYSSESMDSLQSPPTPSYSFGPSEGSTSGDFAANILFSGSETTAMNNSLHIFSHADMESAQLFVLQKDEFNVVQCIHPGTEIVFHMGVNDNHGFAFDMDDFPLESSLEGKNVATQNTSSTSNFFPNEKTSIRTPLASSSKTNNGIEGEQSVIYLTPYSVVWCEPTRIVSQAYNAIHSESTVDYSDPASSRSEDTPSADDSAIIESIHRSPKLKKLQDGTLLFLACNRSRLLNGTSESNHCRELNHSLQTIRIWEDYRLSIEVNVLLDTCISRILESTDSVASAPNVYDGEIKNNGNSALEHSSYIEDICNAKSRFTIRVDKRTNVDDFRSAILEYFQLPMDCVKISYLDDGSELKRNLQLPLHRVGIQKYTPLLLQLGIPLEKDEEVWHIMFSLPNNLDLDSVTCSCKRSTRRSTMDSANLVKQTSQLTKALCSTCRSSIYKSKTSQDRFYPCGKFSLSKNESLGNILARLRQDFLRNLVVAIGGAQEGMHRQLGKEANEYPESNGAIAVSTASNEKLVESRRIQMLKLISECNTENPLQVPFEVVQKFQSILLDSSQSAKSCSLLQTLSTRFPLEHFHLRTRMYNAQRCFHYLSPHLTIDAIQKALSSPIRSEVVLQYDPKLFNSTSIHSGPSSLTDFDYLNREELTRPDASEPVRIDIAITLGYWNLPALSSISKEETIFFDSEQASASIVSLANLQQANASLRPSAQESKCKFLRDSETLRALPRLHPLFQHRPPPWKLASSNPDTDAEEKPSVSTRLEPPFLEALRNMGSSKLRIRVPTASSNASCHSSISIDEMPHEATPAVHLSSEGNKTSCEATLPGQNGGDKIPSSSLSTVDKNNGQALDFTAVPTHAENAFAKITESASPVTGNVSCILQDTKHSTNICNAELLQAPVIWYGSEVIVGTRTALLNSPSGMVLDPQLICEHIHSTLFPPNHFRESTKSTSKEEISTVSDGSTITASKRCSRGCQDYLLLYQPALFALKNKEYFWTNSPKTILQMNQCSGCTKGFLPRNWEALIDNPVKLFPGTSLVCLWYSELAEFLRAPDSHEYCVCTAPVCARFKRWALSDGEIKNIERMYCLQCTKQSSKAIDSNGNVDNSAVNSSGFGYIFFGGQHSLYSANATESDGEVSAGDRNPRNSLLSSIRKHPKISRNVNEGAAFRIISASEQIAKEKLAKLSQDLLGKFKPKEEP